MNQCNEPEHRYINNAKKSFDAGKKEFFLPDCKSLCKLLVDISPTVIIAVQDGRCQFVNPTGVSTLGLNSHNSIIGKPVTEFIDPAYHEDFNACLQNEGTPVEISFRRADGNPAILESRSHHAENSGHPILLIIETDITKKKKAEESYRESNNRYLSLAENSPDVIMRYDRQGRHLYVNKKIEEVGGIPPQAFIGKTHRELNFPEEKCKFWEKHIQKAFETGKPLETEFELPYDNTRIMNWRLIPEFSEDGSVQTVLGITRDMTDLKRFVEEQEKLISLVENSKEFIGLASIDGAVSYLNKSGRELVGLRSMEEVKKKTIFDFVAEDHRIKLQDEIIPHLMQNGIWTGQNRLRHFETHMLIEVDITAFFVYSKDSKEPIALATVMRDITEKKYLETQLIQSQKMEAIGTLAGGIAHDFNNILAIIIGYTELILDQTEKTSEIFDDLQEILNSGYRAKELVSQILTFSRKQQEKRKAVNVNVIVKEITKFLRATLPTTIEIRQHITEEPHYILADPTQIHQILMNLCTNAAFSMRENGGMLDIHIQQVELSEKVRKKHPKTLPGPHIKITVKDTGSGMPPEVLSRIFEPYFTTKGIGEGTGLGLSVVHGIVKSYKGFIDISSTVGKGSVFHVYMPATETMSYSGEIENESLPVGTERIIIVGDEPNILAVTKRILEKLGYSVFPFELGQKAIAAFRAAPDTYDLIITDMTMPKITGEKLAQEMLDIRSDIPIILCTGFNESITTEKAKKLGILRLLHKPVSINELAGAVHAAFNKK